jgi:hypothetical protein
MKQIQKVNYRCKLNVLIITFINIRLCIIIKNVLCKITYNYTMYKIKLHKNIITNSFDNLQ